MKIATILLLTSLSSSSSNAETSFLRASISNDGDGDALRCLGECADEDIYNGKKKHPTKKKVFTKATDCASACLPATQRNEATISCATKCFKKQASDVEKAVDKAIDKEIKDCEKKCDEDDKDCEKKCDRKYKSGSRSKNVSKAVEKKVFKMADSNKKCLAKCVMPSDDVDFMELIDYENSEDFTFEEASGDKTSEDGNSSDYDQFLELSEKNLGDDCPDDFPDGFCEAIKKLLKKLRERSDGDGIIRPKSATALK
ncbi:hypothetical protein QTG54_009846 [Skeletonema marinoi]|uniref:Uncharacterized protein n=1 Tax=Skeletonema marinoi TaxID=267567 RepID=A0AAD9DB49_9STRA|nr:hypothetical protein QTG54_009846 [Skeletonema marinoi]